MVIDLILDRKDGIFYDPKEFAREVKEYAEIFPICAPVYRAIETGKEWAVKIALETYLEKAGCPWPDLFEYIESVRWLPVSEQRDYKERFIALLDEMEKDGNGGLIPAMIGEGLRECEAWSKEGYLDYYTVKAIYRQ